MWLNIYYIRIIRSSVFLDHKQLELFQITRKLDTLTYKLDLSEYMKIYFVFYVWLLYSYDANFINEQEVSLCELAEIYEDSATEHLADKVVDFRVIKQINSRTKIKSLL